MYNPTKFVKYSSERPAENRVNNLDMKINEVLDMHFARSKKWSNRMSNKSRDLADKMIKDYKKKKCPEEEGSGEGSGEGMGDYDDLERSDRSVCQYVF